MKLTRADIRIRERRARVFIIIYHRLLLPGRRHRRSLPFPTLSRTVINITSLVRRFAFGISTIVFETKLKKASKNKDATPEYMNPYYETEIILHIAKKRAQNKETRDLMRLFFARFDDEINHCFTVE